MQRNVLLADNSVAVQKTFGLAFANDDVAIVIAEDGDTALRQARAVRPHLVLTSLALPGTNGYELCESIKRECGPTAVLLLAGEEDGIDLERAKRADCDGYLVKPFDARTLIEAVEAVLARVSRRQETALASTRSTVGAPEADRVRGEDEPFDPAKRSVDKPVQDEKVSAHRLGDSSQSLTNSAALQPAEDPKPSDLGRAETTGAALPTRRKSDRSRSEETTGRSAPHPDLQKALETAAREAFKELSESMLDEILDKIELIAWEVIPEMAEIALRHQLNEGNGTDPPPRDKVKPRP